MINWPDDQRGAVMWRNALAFCVMGLSNNFPIRLMISASEDIIKMHNTDNNYQNGSIKANATNLQCLPSLGVPRCERVMSTGAVLLANNLPSLTIQFTSFIFMNRIPFSFRHFLVCSLQIISFLLVGFSKSTPMAMVGVAFGSVASGFGEICFLALTSFYDRSSFFAWCLGCGGSGIIGAIVYASLTEPKLLGISPQNAIVCMLIMPTLYFLTYWFVLVHSPLMHKSHLLRPSSWVVPAIRRPKVYAIGNGILPDTTICATSGTHEFEFWQKLKIIKSLLRYMIPICIVYLLDNLINSGLLQHIKFNCAHSFDLSLPSQFRWLQTFHLMGIFLPRLSAIFVEMPLFVLYSLPFLMLMNLVLFFGQALFSFIPHMSFVFIIIFFEGIVGGACYPFFGKIHKKASPEVKEFSMAVILLGASVGITLASFLSILAHKIICQFYQNVYP